MGLSNLPYDLLLNIALYLDLRDIHALHQTCKTLNDFTTTRPVYRKLAVDLLRKCRALPLKGFQRLTDLTTEQLIRSVNQAARYDNAWRRRAPRPIGKLTSTYGTSHYMDGPSHSTSLAPVHPARTWYKVVSAPPGEEVDWLSPITSSYTLCATKSGKVVCWDVQTDSCLAEWNPGERWELWKCRVEFEERTVYFTMAKILDGSQDDSRVMEFVLMRLTFSDPPSGESSLDKPIFSPVTEFRTTGVVMNIFLLDPSERLLSAFVWVASSNTIGLYALLDWSKPEYVFIDTGIEYAVSANWSCILYDQHIVIHCEEPEAAHQYFYPFSLLSSRSTSLPNRLSHPQIICRMPPARSLTKKFVFPRITHEAQATSTTGTLDEDMIWLNTLSPHMVLLLPSITPTQAIGAAQLAPVTSATTTATVGSTTPPNAAASSSSSSSAAFVASPSSAASPPPQPLSQPHASSSSSSPSASTSISITSTTSVTLPTPTAPLLPHASLPVPQSTTDSHPSSHHPSSSSSHTSSPPPQASNPNPFPFPTWYPESAHFVRQWWPSLPHIPRVSCTVVLLAMHDQETHRNRFVLAQHYFKVPIDWGMWVRGEGITTSEHATPTHTTPTHTTPTTPIHPTSTTGIQNRPRMAITEEEREGDEDLMKMWYVSKPFEVVRVYDEREDDENQMFERPRPLVAVDFGHAVWIEYCDDEPTTPLPVSRRPRSPPPANTAASASGGSGISIVEGNGTGGNVTVAFPHTDNSENHPGADDDDEMTPIPGSSGAVADSEVVITSALADVLEEQEQDSDPKALRFVTFPGYEDEYEEEWVEEEVEIEVEVDADLEEVPEGSTKSKGKGKGKERARDGGDEVDEWNGGVEGKGRGKGKGKGKSGTPYINGSSDSTTWTYANGHSTHSIYTSQAPLLPPSSKKTIKKKTRRRKRRNRETEGVVRTLEVPDELDLGTVETINIDQSQGAVILSDREGKIFILCYE